MFYFSEWRMYLIESIFENCAAFFFTGFCLAISDPGFTRQCFSRAVDVSRMRLCCYSETLKLRI